MTESRKHQPRIRLAFLDGIRGWAALYVVVVHACYGAFFTPASDGWMAFQQFFSYGRIAVSIFIVLSGFCLMLPLASIPTQHCDRIWWKSYIKRRFRRIVPPYFFALVLSLLLLAILPESVTRQGWAGSFWPVFRIDVILSHVLLIHNLSNDWISRINPPFWSVATEWQIYFLFPLILLPLMRRVGWLASVAAGFILPLLIILIFRRFDTAAPWFLGLFALGMTVACLAVSGGEARGKCRRTLGHPFMVAAGLSAAMAVAVWKDSGPFANDWKGLFVVESVAGAACAIFIMWLCGRGLLKADEKPIRGPVARAIAVLLESHPSVWLGKISYSLYLTHALALMVSSSLVARLDLRGTAHTLSHLSIALVFSLLLAWIFYRWCERPFSSRPKPVLATPNANNQKPKAVVTTSVQIVTSNEVAQ